MWEAQTQSVDKKSLFTHVEIITVYYEAVNNQTAISTETISYKFKTKRHLLPTVNTDQPNKLSFFRNNILTNIQNYDIMTVIYHERMYGNDGLYSHYHHYNYARHKYNHVFAGLVLSYSDFKIVHHRITGYQNNDGASRRISICTVFLFLGGRIMEGLKELTNCTARPTICEVGKDELNECLEIIHQSFSTVADEFALTQENCPKHTSFIPLYFLESQMNWGWHMYALYDGVSSQRIRKASS